MKQATLFFALILLVTPASFASAQVPCGPNGGYCPAGQVCLSQTTGTCGFSNPGGGGGGGGGAGGLNTTLLATYAQQIVWFINFVLVPLLMAIAFIVFLWGVFNYFIYGADDSEKRKEGKNFVLYGVIGFVIIFSIWGLVNVGVTLLNLPIIGGRPATLPYPTL